MPSDFYQEEDYSGEMTGQVYRRILDFLKPHWLWIIGFLITITIVSILDAVFTYLSKQIVDQGILSGDTGALYRILKIYGVLILVQSAGIFGFIFLVGVLGERVRYDLRQKLFNHLQSLSLSYYSRTPVGWIISRVTSDTERIAELVSWGLLDVTWGVMSVTISMIFMFISIR